MSNAYLNFKKGIFLFILVLITTTRVFASGNPLDLEPSNEWQLYATIDGVKIEYRVAACESNLLKNHMNCWFRFTNETTEKQSFKWTVKYFRDDECYNCTRLDNPEYTHELILEAGETIAADQSKMDDQAMYLFNYFIVKSPGMTDSKLTAFEFINTEVNQLITE